MNDKDIVSDLAVVVEMFNVYALFLLVLGGVVIWAVNTGVQNLSHKLMDRLPTRRFLILQVSTLIGFMLYIVGSVALVVGVLQPPKEFMLPPVAPLRSPLVLP